MKKLLLVITALCGCVTLFAAEPVSAKNSKDLCGFSYSDIDELDAMVADNREYDKRTASNGGSIIYSNDETRRKLTIMLPVHPSYPAAICQEFVFNSSGITMVANIDCRGPKEACDFVAAHIAKVIRQAQQNFGL